MRWVCGGLVLALACGAFGYPNYTFQALPVPIDRPHTPRAMNNSGVVVGHTIDSFGSEAPFYFLPNWGTIYPGQYLNTRGTLFWDVNESGVATGWSGQSVGSPRCLLWDPEQQYRALGILSGFGRGFGVSINDQNWVAGISAAPSGETRATLWVPGQQPRNLGLIGGLHSEAWGINNVGEVYGYGENWKGQVGVRWSEATGLKLLAPLPVNGNGTASDMDDNGTIIGATLDVDGTYQPTIWRRGKGAFRAQKPAGTTSGGLSFMLGNGLYLGEASGPGGRGLYLWQEGQTPRFLSELLDLQSLGWTDIVIHASNRVGQFVGYGKLNGQLRTLIASPVP